jgi:hypothetical protein
MILKSNDSSYFKNHIDENERYSYPLTLVWHQEEFEDTKGVIRIRK